MDNDNQLSWNLLAPGAFDHIDPAETLAVYGPSMTSLYSESTYWSCPPLPNELAIDGSGNLIRVSDNTVVSAANVENGTVVRNIEVLLAGVPQAQVMSDTHG